MDRFSICLPYILQAEGGNSDDPDDPGGRTSRGITQREYNTYRQSKGEPIGDVWQAADEEVSDIYRTSYWEPWCPLMPVGVDLCLFNMSVNSGPVQAAKLLQRALDVADDGHIGPITLAALKNFNAIKLIAGYSDQSRAFYEGLGRLRKFLKGWLNRVATIEQVALKMAAGG